MFRSSSADVTAFTFPDTAASSSSSQESIDPRAPISSSLSCDMMMKYKGENVTVEFHFLFGKTVVSESGTHHGLMHRE